MQIRLPEAMYVEMSVAPRSPAMLRNSFIGTFAPPTLMALISTARRVMFPVLHRLWRSVSVDGPDPSVQITRDCSGADQIPIHATHCRMRLGLRLETRGGDRGRCFGSNVEERHCEFADTLLWAARARCRNRQRCDHLTVVVA